MQIAEGELICKCKIGDIEAFEELISKYEKKVFNICLRILGNYGEAEDVSQDVFIKVFKYINSFKGNSSFYTWLYRITVNECMDLFNKKKKVIAFSMDEPIENGEEEVQREYRDKHESVEEKVERIELRKNIETGMQKLSIEHRTMIVLRDIQGFSYEEIAEMLGCPPGTVKSRINRARSHLKDILLEDKELFLNYKV